MSLIVFLFRFNTHTRSTAPSLLSIWTHHLRGLTYNSSFSTPCIFWTQHRRYLYQTRRAQHKIYIYQTRRAQHDFHWRHRPKRWNGCYLISGSQSPLGSKYGTVVDNVLEINVVTSSGTVVVANDCENANLFWAMKGVGGNSPMYLRCIFFLLTSR